MEVVAQGIANMPLPSSAAFAWPARLHAWRPTLAPTPAARYWHVACRLRAGVHARSVAAC